jgi:hypothetical protein
LNFSRERPPHPHLHGGVNNSDALLLEMGLTEDQVRAHLRELVPELFNKRKFAVTTG